MASAAHERAGLSPAPQLPRAPTSCRRRRWSADQPRAPAPPASGPRDSHRGRDVPGFCPSGSCRRCPPESATGGQGGLQNPDRIPDRVGCQVGTPWCHGVTPRATVSHLGGIRLTPPGVRLAPGGVRVSLLLGLDPAPCGPPLSWPRRAPGDAARCRSRHATLTREVAEPTKTPIRSIARRDSRHGMLHGSLAGIRGNGFTGREAAAAVIVRMTAQGGEHGLLDPPQAVPGVAGGQQALARGNLSVRSPRIARPRTTPAGLRCLGAEHVPAIWQGIIGGPCFRARSGGTQPKHRHRATRRAPGRLAARTPAAARS